MKTLVAFRLPKNLLRNIEKVSKQLQCSKTFIVQKALEEYLEEYLDYQIALERLKDKDDEIITTAKEMNEIIT